MIRAEIKDRQLTVAIQSHPRNIEKRIHSHQPIETLGHQRSYTVSPFKTDTAAINKSTFFPKVSQLVKVTASPKHPQSDIGLERANHKVSGVITPMISTTNKVVILLRIPNKRYTPKQNSTIACNTDARNGRKAGTEAAQPKPPNNPEFYIEYPADLPL